MTATHDFDELAERLVALGEMLDVGDADPASTVLDRLRAPRERAERVWPRRLLVAAAAVVLVTVTVLLVPDARRAVARWLGIGGVEVQVDPTLDVGAPETFDAGGTTPLDRLPAPGEQVVVEVSGRQVQVSAFAARENEMLIRKTVGASGDAREVTVHGHPGIWVSAPHEVVYELPDGSVTVQRVASRTLLWFDGEVLYRVEGFDDLDAALAFVGNLDGSDGVGGP